MTIPLEFVDNSLSVYFDIHLARKYQQMGYLYQSDYCHQNIDIHHIYCIMQKKGLIIIGAGPSGIAAAKYAKQSGLDFVLFQKSADIGGIWNPDTGLVWETLQTNNCRENCKFTDFDYPFEPQIFPTNKEFFKYMKAYAEHFKIIDHIVFNCEVQYLCRQPETGEYIVTTKQGDKVLERRATNVIVASGLFSEQYIPKDIPGLQNFKGQVCHSRNYKNRDHFKNRKVLVIGGSFTGVEIASDLTNSCDQVYHTFRLPFFLLPRFIKTSHTTLIAMDLLNYKRKPDLAKPMLVPSESAIFQKQSQMLKACQEQQKHPQLRIQQQDIKQPLSKTISSGYLEGITNGKIIPYRTTIAQVKEKSVILGNGEQIFVDTIMLCTGCHSSLKYLSDEIQQIVKAKPWVQKHPTVMFKSILHPKLPNLYFMGILRGILIPICEMQARFVIQMITGQGRFPTQQEIAQDIEVQQNYRDLKRIPQSRFPHPVYCDTLLPYLNLPINLHELKQKQPEKFNEFINLPLIQNKLSWTTLSIDQQIQNSKKALERSTIKINPQ